MYKLKIKGFGYISAVCPRCGSLNTVARKKSRLYCRRDGYEGHWKEFYLGSEREKVQKAFMQQISKELPPIGFEHK